jgi:TorA maturation chaperone TorD
MNAGGALGNAGVAGRAEDGGGIEALSSPQVPDVETIMTAAGLLSHFWTRPVVEETSIWVECAELLADTQLRLGTERELLALVNARDESPELADEYERLFVGPGQVPCPPYESFWREDVPVDIRRTLMGPCTAELKELYGELELQVATGSCELADHVAIELEALSYALSLEGADDLARRLVDEHLAVFLPRLCRAVGHETENAFYRDLAALTIDWLAAIKAYFALVETG